MMSPNSPAMKCASNHIRPRVLSAIIFLGVVINMICVGPNEFYFYIYGLGEIAG